MPDYTIICKYVPHYDASHAKLSVVITESGAAGGKNRFVYSVLASIGGAGVICQKRVFNTQYEERRFTENGHQVLYGTKMIWQVILANGTSEEFNAFNRALFNMSKSFYAFDSEFKGKGALDSDTSMCIYNANSQFIAEMKLTTDTLPPDHDLLVGEVLDSYRHGWHMPTRRTDDGFSPDDWKIVNIEKMGQDKWKRIYESVQNSLMSDHIRFRHVDDEKQYYTDPLTMEGNEYIFIRAGEYGSRLLGCLKVNPESGWEGPIGDGAGTVQAAQGEGKAGNVATGRSRIYMARLTNVKGLTEFVGGGLYRIKDGTKINLNGRNYITVINDQGEERVLDEGRVKYEQVYAVAPEDGAEMAPDQRGRGNDLQNDVARMPIF